MARSPFVTPDTVRLPLAEGDWVDVKKYLTAGEKKALEGAGLVAIKRTSDPAEGAAFELDFKRLGLALIEAYAVDWSFVDAKGAPTKPTPENIAALDPDTATELQDAISAHVQRMEAEKNARTPSRAGESK